jgi:hypothetical protein
VGILIRFSGLITLDAALRVENGSFHAMPNENVGGKFTPIKGGTEFFNVNKVHLHAAGPDGESSVGIPPRRNPYGLYVISLMSLNPL